MRSPWILTVFKKASLQANRSILSTFFTLTILSVLCIFSGSTFAAEMTLEWEPPTASVSPSGYRVYYGNSSGAYQFAADAGSRSSYTITGLEGGKTYYFAVRSYDVCGNESSLSNELICHTVTASAGSNGTITPNGTVVLEKGGNQAFTITASSGYRITDVLVDGKSVGAVSAYTLSNVSANHTISASFAANQTQTYIITATAGSNGSISPSGSVTVSQGAGRSFTITPAQGYRISDVLVDGKSVGAVSAYTFSNVSANHTISASFTSANQKPIADAGPDQTLKEGVTATLTGSNSTDPDDGIASYQWTQLSGPSVKLSNTTATSPTFKTPDVSSDGAALTFSLTVTDRGGLQSTDTCIVNVTWVNAPPIASAGGSQTVAEWSTVVLDGSDSTDPDDGIAAYSWVQVGGAPVALQDPDAATCSFDVEDVTADGQSLAFELTVTDQGGLQSTDTCIVNVTWVNNPPQANAGADQSVSAGKVVTLNGSGSSDIDDGIASYRWTQTSGPPVTLSDPTAVKPAFTSPNVGSEATVLGFTLTVTDKGGLQSAGSCKVTVSGSANPDLTGSWTKFSSSRWTAAGTFQVRNAGNKNAGKFTAEVYLSDDGVKLTKLLKKYTVGSLSAGKSTNLSFAYISSNMSGKFLIVVIDAQNSIPELNESNNKVSRKIP